MARTVSSSSAQQAAALEQLISRALEDGTCYSALVPWVLSRQGICLGTWAAEHPALQQLVVHLADLQAEECCAYLAKYIRDQCQSAAARTPVLTQPHLGSGACSDEPQGRPCLAGASVCAAQGSGFRPGTALPATRAGDANSSPLNLPASRLAKLHGHMLAHGLLTPAMDQLSTLVSMLLAAPVPPLERQGMGCCRMMPGINSISSRTHSSTGSGNSSIAGGYADSQTTAGANAGTSVAAVVNAVQAGVQKGSDTPASSTHDQRAQSDGASLSQQHSQCLTDVAARICSSTPLCLCCCCRKQRALVAAEHAPPAVLLCCTRAAAKYAAKALDCSGRLVQSLGRQLTELLVANAQLQCHGPELAQALARRLQQQKQQRQQSGQTQPAAAGANAQQCVPPPVALLMQHSWLAGGVQSPAAARRTANAEKCRDAFFGVVREAKARSHALHHHHQQQQQHQQQQPNISGALLSLLADLRSAMHELLQQLQPCNLPHLADLITACALQAVATGEAPADARMAELAHKQPVRFQKLNQRLQQGAKQSNVPSSGGSRTQGRLTAVQLAPQQASLWHKHGAANGSATGSLTKQQPANRAMASNAQHPLPYQQVQQEQVQQQQQQQQQQQEHVSTTAVGQKHVAGRSSRDTSLTGAKTSSSASLPNAEGEAAAAALQQLLAEFPTSQHAFVLLLSAADSARLNTALYRACAARMQQLLHVIDATDSSAAEWSQQACAISTLGLYLGYLTLGHGKLSAGMGRVVEGSHVGTALHPLGSFDVLRLLQLCSSSANPRLLALGVPASVHCLSVQRHDPELAASPGYGAAVCWLRRLLALPAMQPVHAGFTPLGMCLRSVVEQLIARLDEPGNSFQQQQQQQQQQASPHGQEHGWQPDGAEQQHRSLVAGQLPDTAFDADAITKQLLDPWAVSGECLHASYISLCCPTLQALQQQLALANAMATAQHAKNQLSQTEAGSIQGVVQAPKRRLAPAMLPAVFHLQTSPHQAPSALRAVLTASHDAVDMQLQQALLNQYSCDQDLVKLRNVMASVSDMLGAHGFALGMQQHVPDVLQRHLENLARKARQQLLHGSAAEGPVASSAHQDVQQSVQALCSSQAAAAVHDALEAAFGAARAHIMAATPQVLAALLAFDMPAAVKGAAAAMAAQSALLSCAQRLLQQVPVVVHQQMLQQSDGLARGIIKEQAVQARMIGAPVAPSAACVRASSSISDSYHGSSPGRTATHSSTITTTTTSSTTSSSSSNGGGVCGHLHTIHQGACGAGMGSPAASATQPSDTAAALATLPVKPQQQCLAASTATPALDNQPRRARRITPSPSDDCKVGGSAQQAGAAAAFATTNSDWTSSNTTSNQTPGLQLDMQVPQQHHVAIEDQPIRTHLYLQLGGQDKATSVTGTVGSSAGNAGMSSKSSIAAVGDGLQRLAVAVARLMDGIDGQVDNSVAAMLNSVAAHTVRALLSGRPADVLQVLAGNLEHLQPPQHHLPAFAVATAQLLLQQQADEAAADHVAIKAALIVLVHASQQAAQPLPSATLNFDSNSTDSTVLEASYRMAGSASAAEGAVVAKADTASVLYASPGVSTLQLACYLLVTAVICVDLLQLTSMSVVWTAPAQHIGSFTELLTLLLRQVRGSCPYWALHLLRVWLQQATLSTAAAAPVRHSGTS